MATTTAASVAALPLGLVFGVRRATLLRAKLKPRLQESLLFAAALLLLAEEALRLVFGGHLG